MFARLAALLSVAALLLSGGGAFAQSVAAEADRIDVAYLFSDGNMSGTLAAYRKLLEEHPELDGRIGLNFLTESFFDSADPERLNNSDVLVLDMMNQQMMERYNQAHDTNLIREVTRNGTVLAVGVGVQPKEYYTDQGALWDERALAYWQNGGQANQLALLKFALREAGVEGLGIPDPQPSLEFGYYYPDGDSGRVFATWEEFDAWRAANGKTAPGRTRVAIGFYRSTFYDSETGVVDAMIAEVEKQGAEAIPFFGYPDGVAFERMLLDESGVARADVALSLLMRFADFEVTEALAKIDIPVINTITLYGRSEQEWREEASGLSQFEGTFQVAVPELAGLVAPTVVGSREKVFDDTTGISIVVNTPIASRIEMAVKRGLRYARLQEKTNAERRIALLYYNYPVGKANIGASYLNIADSLSLILTRMREEGYDVGDADLSADAILNDITTKARNVGGFAPGELDEMVAQNAIAYVDMPTYRAWLDGFAPEFRDRILADWGAPEDETLMAVGEGVNKAFVIPRLEYGNVILMPQPARGWGEDLEQLYHADNLAPHHQYVAAYAWLRNEIDVDAVVHMGTHGTLEWLDGKDIGLDERDASDALMADLPDLYIYNVDVVGEGLVARRRGMATLVDHMVPPFVQSDLYPELAALGESINSYDVNLHKNPELAHEYVGDIIERVIAQGIDKALGLELEGVTALDDATVHEIQDYLLELKTEFIPFGLHAFGRLPTEEMRASTVDAIVAVDRSLLPDQKTVLADEMDQRIVASASAELDSLMRAMRGGYIKGSSGGEPIRNPDAYPTGRNFYGIDPEKVPRKASWELGVKLADQMLAQHLAEHGEYPQKVSFVIWGDETMRHEGVLESQIFHLLGTRPVWDARDKVVGVEVVPRSQLGRPRVDIIIASAADGMFNNVTVLMDEAVQKVKALEEAENFVRDHYLATKAALVDMGYSEADADARAGVRIFDEPPGIHNLNTAGIAAASGTWDSDVGMANDYINKMGHGFGNGFWGEPMQDVFRLALDGVEKVVHSSSTTLYGGLDNDDFFMYMGGLAGAVRTVSGENPELVVTNTRDPADPEMSSLDKFLATDLQTRYFNPRWIEGMQTEGYAGARTMVEFVEYLWGWDATVNDVVDDRMWQETFEVYVQDKHDMNMKEFFETESPYAFQDVAARMLETIRKEYWNTDDATRNELLTRYVESVNAHGINCTEVSCGNARLMHYVLEQAQLAEIPQVSLDQFRAAVEAAIKGSIEQLADVQENFARSNDARIEAMYGAGPGPSELSGFRMERITDTPARQMQTASAPADDRPSALLLQAAVLAMLALWWFRRRQQAG